MISVANDFKLVPQSPGEYKYIYNYGQIYRRVTIQYGISGRMLINSMEHNYAIMSARNNASCISMLLAPHIVRSLIPNHKNIDDFIPICIIEKSIYLNNGLGMGKIRKGVFINKKPNKPGYDVSFICSKNFKDEVLVNGSIIKSFKETHNPQWRTLSSFMVASPYEWKLFYQALKTHYDTNDNVDTFIQMITPMLPPIVTDLYGL
jgi:hypothetical protein